MFVIFVWPLKTLDFMGWGWELSYTQAIPISDWIDIWSSPQNTLPLFNLKIYMDKMHNHICYFPWPSFFLTCCFRDSLIPIGLTQGPSSSRKQWVKMCVCVWLGLSIYIPTAYSPIHLYTYVHISATRGLNSSPWIVIIYQAAYAFLIKTNTSTIVSVSTDI